MRLPYGSLDATRKRLEPKDGIIKLVAEADASSGTEVVGFSELYTFPQAPRHNHVGEINMIVTADDWQGKGVGRALMAAMVDLADNWLRITRLSLVVWTTNDNAVHLYRQFGFEVEGTMRDYAFREGGFIDAYMMGRLRRSA
jgi:putative acetyltransferase